MASHGAEARPASTQATLTQGTVNADSVHHPDGSDGVRHRTASQRPWRGFEKQTIKELEVRLKKPVLLKSAIYIYIYIYRHIYHGVRGGTSECT